MPELASYINWHDEDQLPGLADDFARSFEVLNTQLLREFTPRDLVIGGVAVQAVLNHQDAILRSAPTVSAEVGIEYWAVTEDMVTHVSKTRNDVITAEYAHQLANQVRRSGSWLPLVESRRTARLGRLAAASHHIRVAIFETKKPVDDQAMLAMRRVWEPEREPGDKDPLYMVETCGLAHPAKQPEVLAKASFDAGFDCFWKLFEAKQAQGEELMTLLKDRTLARAAGKPTREQVIHHAQRAIDQNYADMQQQALNLQAAARNVQQGVRVRPSKPLHNI